MDLKSYHVDTWDSSNFLCFLYSVTHLHISPIAIAYFREVFYYVNMLCVGIKRGQERNGSFYNQRINEIEADGTRNKSREKRRGGSWEGNMKIKGNQYSP
jgi:hypothetical protein